MLGSARTKCALELLLHFWTRQGLRGGGVHGAGGGGHELQEGHGRRARDRREHAHLRPDKARSHGEAYPYNLYAFYHFHIVYLYTAADETGRAHDDHGNETEDLFYYDSYLFAYAFGYTYVAFIYTYVAFNRYEAGRCV